MCNSDNRCPEPPPLPRHTHNPNNNPPRSPNNPTTHPHPPQASSSCTSGCTPATSSSSSTRTSTRRRLTSTSPSRSSARSYSSARWVHGSGALVVNVYMFCLLVGGWMLVYVFVLVGGWGGEGGEGRWCRCMCLVDGWMHNWVAPQAQGGYVGVGVCVCLLVDGWVDGCVALSPASAPPLPPNNKTIKTHAPPPPNNHDRRSWTAGRPPSRA